MIDENDLSWIFEETTESVDFYQMLARNRQDAVRKENQSRRKKGGICDVQYGKR